MKEALKLKPKGTQSPRALITGISGHDGPFLAHSLLDKDYEVHGVFRQSDGPYADVLARLLSDFEGQFILHQGDVTDLKFVNQLFKTPFQEVYHLAAINGVSQSIKNPPETIRVNCVGTVNMLEAVKNLCPEARFFQACSSEIFGIAKQIPQTEQTPIAPINPYGCSKTLSYNLVNYYRRAYGLYAVNAISYNHESYRREKNYVSRKITSSIAAIAMGQLKELSLGRIDIKRDFLFISDYIEAAYAMLQIDTPQDLILSSGESHSIREFMEKAFELVDLDAESYLNIDVNLIRPLDIKVAHGDSSYAQKLLDWQPQIDFETMIKIMLAYDLKLLGADLNDFPQVKEGEKYLQD